MQKIWQKGIVGIIMLGIFLLPISTGINIKENKLAVSIEINEIRAQEEVWWFQWYVPVVGNSGIEKFTATTSDQAKKKCEETEAGWTTGKISTSCTNKPIETATATTEFGTATTVGEIEQGS